MGPIQGGLKGDMLALEDPPLVLPGDLPHLLDDPSDRVEVHVPGPAYLLCRCSGFSQAGLLQDADVGDLAPAYPFDVAVVQALGQVHHVTGRGAVDVHA